MIRSSFSFVVIACILLLTGCAHKPVHVATAELVYKRDCIENVQLNDSTECRGPDAKHLHCSGIKLDVKAGCAQLQIIKQEIK